MSDTAIKIENLKKQYKLGTIGGQTLNAELQSWWARKRGKEDPNLKIGQDYTNFGESFYALNGINLEIKKGEALGIIGGNGAGKSTLLKILSRVTAPTEGDVWIDGRVVSMLEVGTGFHGELTGRENIYMNGAILGMTKKEVDEKIESIIDFSECRQFIDTPVKRYSSGMYVKLAFAVASHLDAEIMVMDEVLAVGDMAFQKKCLGKMGEEAHGGKTILYVSHNMETIRTLCTRCIVLNKGVVVYAGDVETAISIYMNETRGDLICAYDYTEKKRKNIDLGNNVRISKFGFLGKDVASFSNNEHIVMELEIESSIEVSNLRMGLHIWNADNTVAGMSESKNICDMHSGDKVRVNFEFDPSNLASGIYKAVIFIYEFIGIQKKDVDETPDYIWFEIRDESKDMLIWERKYWGNVRLNPIIIESLEREL